MNELVSVPAWKFQQAHSKYVDWRTKKGWIAPDWMMESTFCLGYLKSSCEIDDDSDHIIMSQEAADKIEQFLGPYAETLFEAIRANRWYGDVVGQGSVLTKLPWK